MSTNPWLTTDEVIGLAYEAGSRSEFRSEVLRRMMSTLGCEMGLFACSDSPPSAGDLVNISTRTAEQARHHFVAPEPGLGRAVKELATRGALVDTEVYVPREWERLSYVERVQRRLGVTSSLVIALPSRVGATVVCLSRAGGRLASHDAACASRLVKALGVADRSLSWSTTIGMSIASRLTSRQRQIAALVAEGWSNAQIGRICGVSGNTVRNHLVKLFEQFEVGTRTELAVQFKQSQVAGSNKSTS